RRRGRRARHHPSRRVRRHAQRRRRRTADAGTSPGTRMNLPSNPLPNFRDADTLLAHIRDTMAFYDPVALDPDGGFFHSSRDDGSVYDASPRHLVSSTRFVFNYAMAAVEFGRDDYRERARHGLRYLREAHRDPHTGGYAWTIRDGRPEDRMNH